MSELINDLRAYFETKSSLTTEEQVLLERLPIGYFTITSVHRDDLASKGFDVNNVSDGDMETLASKMADDYCTQLFWESMEIIAKDYLKIPKNPCCPKCEDESVIFDPQKQVYQCQTCGQEWHKDLYVLVEFPDDTSYFEQEEIGYPGFNSEDNSARYAPEYEYILHFQKNPEPNSFFYPVKWPESQQYLNNEEDDSIEALNELINDEKGLEDFGSSTVWVPLCNLNNDKS